MGGYYSTTKNKKTYDQQVQIRRQKYAFGTKLNFDNETELREYIVDYINQLNDKKIAGLIGVDSKIGEGSDTRNVDVLILANFVASKGPVIQAIGRALRKQESKTKALILDYIPKGSTMLSRHGRNRISYYLDITDKVKVITI